jgi:hypothetical protein
MDKGFENAIVDGKRVYVKVTTEGFSVHLPGDLMNITHRLTDHQRNQIARRFFPQMKKPAGRVI